MAKEVVYDFVCDTAVAVHASEGTNPEELTVYAVQAFIQQFLDGQMNVYCDNIYDPETGHHSKPDISVEDFDAGL